MPGLFPGSLTDGQLWAVAVLSTRYWVSMLRIVAASWWVFPLVGMKWLFVSSDCFGLKILVYVFRYYSNTRFLGHLLATPLPSSYSKVVSLFDGDVCFLEVTNR